MLALNRLQNLKNIESACGKLKAQSTVTPIIFPMITQWDKAIMSPFDGQSD